MNLFLHLVAVVSLQCGSVIVNGQNYVLTSSCGGGVTEGSSCVLTCETGDASETPIAWTRGSSSTFEVARATCTTSTPPVPSDYVLTCTGTSFTLNITAASVTRDKTTWRCSYSLGGKPSNPINPDVQVTTTTPPTTTATTSTPASQSTDNPTSTATPGRPTTPTPVGICKNINCNLFLLLLLLLFIPIIVVIIWHRRKKKKPKSNSNVMNTCGEENEPVSDEVQVNKDEVDQMRL